MKRIIDVTLGNKSLRSVSDKIAGVRVEEEARQEEAHFISLAAMPGETIESLKHTALHVSVFVKIRELYDMAARMDAVNAVNKWAARGGSLKLSYRKDGAEELALNVKLTKPASVSDIRDYNAELELIFTSDGWPYWQRQTYVNAMQLSGGQGGGGGMRVGNAPALIDVTVQATAPLSSFSVATGGFTVKLEGLSIPAGGTVEITHDASGIMRVTSGNESLFPYLTDDSADCLISDTDMTRYSFTASAAATAAFKTKGGWY